MADSYLESVYKQRLYGQALFKCKSMLVEKKTSKTETNFLFLSKKRFNHYYTPIRLPVHI